MTPQGLKTFKLASPKPVQLAKTVEGLQEQVTKPTMAAQTQLQIPPLASKPKVSVYN